MNNHDELIAAANLEINRHHFEAAEKIFRSILEQNANSVAALNGLAVINIHQQHYEHALTFLEQALLINSSAAHLHYNTSICHYAQNQIDSALVFCVQAINLDAHYTEAQQFLATLYEQKAAQLANNGEWADALSVLSNSLMLNEHFLTADTFYQLGFYADKAEQYSLAKQHWKKTLSINPHHPYAQAALDNLYHTHIPNWHLPMMNDAVRNKAFQNTIGKMVGNNTTVLDIGAGSGLMSMIAARAGAKKVYACEEVALIADKAAEIIHANGFNDKQISLVKKRSTHITIPYDIPHKVDVIVTETFGTGLIEEHCLDTINHAVKSLLKPGGHIIPKGAALYLCLVESNDLYQLHHVQQACGFNLSAFNEFSEAPKGMWSGHLSHYPYKIISNVQTIETFDFYNQTSLFNEKEITLTANNQGVGHALCMWFDLFLAEDEIITTNPAAEEAIQAKSWGQRIQTLSNPIAVTKNDRLNIKISNVNNYISVTLI